MLDKMLFYILIEIQSSCSEFWPFIFKCICISCWKWNLNEICHRFDHLNNFIELYEVSKLLSLGLWGESYFYKSFFLNLLLVSLKVTGQPLIQRKDDTAEVLKSRLAAFHKQTKPVNFFDLTWSLPFLGNEIQGTLCFEILNRSSHMP